MGFYLNLLSCFGYLPELFGSCRRGKFGGNNAFCLGERSVGQKFVNSLTDILVGDLWGHCKVAGNCVLRWMVSGLLLVCGTKLGCANHQECTMD